MESKWGPRLLLISAIFTFLVVLGLLGLIIFSLFNIDAVTNPKSSFSITIFILVIAIIIGLIKLHASKLMKDPLTTYKGSWLAIILGILTGSFLSLLGGALGLGAWVETQKINQNSI